MPKSPSTIALDGIHNQLGSKQPQRSEQNSRAKTVILENARSQATLPPLTSNPSHLVNTNVPLVCTAPSSSISTHLSSAGACALQNSLSPFRRLCADTLQDRRSADEHPSMSQLVRFQLAIDFRTFQDDLDIVGRRSGVRSWPVPSRNELRGNVALQVVKVRSEDWTSRVRRGPHSADRHREEHMRQGEGACRGSFCFVSFEPRSRQTHLQQRQ